MRDRSRPRRPHRRTRTLAFAVLVVAGTTCGSAALGAQPIDDQAIATTSALREADLPSDFTARATSPSDLSLAEHACRRLRRARTALRSATQVRRAFEDVGRRASVDSTVGIFASKHAAKDVYRDYASPDTVECVTTAIRKAMSSSTDDPDAEVTVTMQPTPDREVGDRAVRYDVVASLRADGTTAPEHLAIEVVRVDRGIATFVFADSQTSPREDSIVAATAAVVARLQDALRPTG